MSLINLFHTTKKILSLTLQCKWAIATEYTAVLADLCWKACNDMDDEAMKSMMTSMMSYCPAIATGMYVITTIDSAEEYFYRTLYQLYSTGNLSKLNTKQMAVLGFSGVMLVGGGIYVLVNLGMYDALLAAGTVTAVIQASTKTNSTLLQFFKTPNPAAETDEDLLDENDEDVTALEIISYKPPTLKPGKK